MSRQTTNCYNELCNLSFYTEFSTYNVIFPSFASKTLSGSWNLFSPILNLVGAWCKDLIMSGFGFLLASSKRTRSEILLFQRRGRKNEINSMKNAWSILNLKSLSLKNKYSPILQLPSALDVSKLSIRRAPNSNLKQNNSCNNF